MVKLALLWYIYEVYWKEEKTTLCYEGSLYICHFLIALLSKVARRVDFDLIQLSNDSNTR